MVTATLAIIAAAAGLSLALASQRMRPRATAAEARIAALDPTWEQRRGQADAQASLRHVRSRFEAHLSEADRLLLQRAGLNLSPLSFLILHAVAGLLTFAIIVSVAGISSGGVALAIAGGAAGFWVPRVGVVWRARKQAKRLELQLIELLSMVATSVRAGFSLTQSLESVGRRLGRPISVGIDRMIADVQLGGDIQDAMRDWADYTGSRDVSIVVTAMLVQRASGGNLAEVLENLAQTMRDRVELRQQLQSITAYSRMTSRVVAVYPFVIALGLTALQPDTWGMLWTTGNGHLFLGLAVVMDVISFFVLRRIATLDF